MNWEAITAVSEIVGATAVVVTLVYLAVQVRQNTAGIRASAYQTWVAASVAEQSSAPGSDVSEAIAAGIFDPTGLTGRNWIRFASYCHLFVLKVESTYYLKQERIISDAVCAKELDRGVNFLLAPGPRQWWEAGARTQFTEEFVKAIERQLDQPTSFQIYSFTPGRGFHAYGGAGSPEDETGKAG